MRLNERRLKQLDREVDAPAWPRTRVPDRPLSLDKVRVHPEEIGGDTAKSRPRPVISSAAGRRLSEAIQLAAQARIGAESHLTELDRIVGDGDMGISLARGAKAIERDLHSYDLDNPAATLAALSRTLREALGGSSGPLYAVFFLRAAKELEHRNMGERPEAQWARAFLAGCQGMSDLGGTANGDRTMLDALWPVCRLDMSDLEYSTPVETPRQQTQPPNEFPPAPQSFAASTSHPKAISGQVAGGIRKDNTDENNCNFQINWQRSGQNRPASERGFRVYFGE